MPFLLGITGGIGSGKTTVAQIFEAFGFPCYNADAQAKILIEQQSEVKNAILNTFGTDAYLENGKYNAAFIRKIVFENPEKLKALNAIVHPAVANDFKLWVSKHSDISILLKEAALLVESGSYKALDGLLTVTAPTEIRKERISKRDPQRSSAEIETIISSQMPDSEKITLSQFVIYNDEKKALIPQVENVIQEIKARFLG